VIALAEETPIPPAELKLRIQAMANASAVAKGVRIARRVASEKELAHLIIIINTLECAC
jgi:hypothetical protein